MPLIKASCPICGDVELALGDIKVLVCSSDGQASYNFACPACGYHVSKPADKAVTDILLSAGAAVTFWRLPQELTEEHAGEPITYDEIVEFHYMLSDDSFMDRLTGALPPKED